MKCSCHGRLRGTRSVLVVLLLLSISGCGKEPAPEKTAPATSQAPLPQTTSAPPPPPSAHQLPPERETFTTPSVGGHETMLERLHQIAGHVTNEHPYMETASYHMMLKELDMLGPETDREDRIHARVRIASHAMQLGHRQAAVQHLDAAYELLDRETDGHRFMGLTIFNAAMSHMRVGLTENWSKINHPENGILPLATNAYHAKPAGSRNAVRLFKDLLSDTPPESTHAFGVRWLLNLAYMTLGEYPDEVPRALLIPTEAFVAEAQIPRFKNIAPRLSLDTFSLAGSVVADDLDGDGNLDLLVSSGDPTENLRCFSNNGDGSFSNVTRTAGLDGILGGINMVQADYDNDGDIDIAVLRGGWLNPGWPHPNSLLRNNGDGTFTDVTIEAGLGNSWSPSLAAAWGDYDNDGDLDLFIGNQMRQPGVGQIDQVAVRKHLDVPSELYRNNGDGTFSDVAKEAGVQCRSVVMGAAWGDYNGDRWPDLYISNAFGFNYLFINNGDGTFRDGSEETRVRLPMDSSAAWFWDFNNDGRLDLFAASMGSNYGDVGAEHAGEDMRSVSSSLYRGNAHGGFREIARRMNIEEPMAVMGGNFGDLDNDGYLDIVLGTGSPDYANLFPNLVFMNEAGERFANATFASGMGQIQKGSGVALADLDNDGDLDVFQQMGGFFPDDRFFDALYENPGFGRHWITVHLVGVRSNRSAIGARLHLVIREGDTPRSIYRTIGSGGSHGCNPLQQTIGTGDAKTVDRLEVYWPTTDETQVFEDLAVGQFIEIVEGKESYRKLEVTKLTF